MVIVQPAVHRARASSWPSAATTHRAAEPCTAGCDDCRTGTGAGCWASASCRRSPISSRCCSVPESPRWHAMHGRLDAARRMLARAHGSGARRARARRGAAPRWRTKRQERRRAARPVGPALRGVLVIGLRRRHPAADHRHQLRARLCHGDLRARRAPAPNASFMQTVLVGLVNVVFTVFALLLIDRVGRRPLLMFGSAGIGGCMLLASYGFQGRGRGTSSMLVLVGLLGFVASFALSLGPGMWVLFSEIFPNRVRGLAISCVGLVNSTVCFIVQFMFPWQMEDAGRRAHLPDLRRVRGRWASRFIWRCCPKRAAAASKSSKNRWCATPESVGARPTAGPGRDSIICRAVSIRPRARSANAVNTRNTEHSHAIQPENRPLPVVRQPGRRGREVLRRHLPEFEDQHRSRATARPAGNTPEAGRHR